MASLLKLLFGGRKRRAPTRRKRGAGFGDFLSSGLSGLGSGLGKGVSNLFSGLFGGKRRKRRVVHRRKRGRGYSAAMLALGRKRRKHRVVRRRKRGGEDTGIMTREEPKIAVVPKTLLGKLHKTFRDTKVISNALKNFNLPFSDSAELLGYGRRKKRRAPKRAGLSRSMFLRR